MDTKGVVDFLNQYRGVAFTWGAMDCSVFIQQYLESATGVDYSYLTDFSWKNKKQAVAYAKATKKGVGDILTQEVRCKVIESKKLIKSGDVVVIDQKGWQTAGIFINGRVAWFREKVGVSIEPLDYNQIHVILRAY